MFAFHEDYFGKDSKVTKALQFAKNLASTKAPILITGESGVGKKTICNFIHSSSMRKNKDILFVDCYEDKETIEKKILGHRDEESGRFQKGILEAANGGSVVLANIDGLDEEFQKKIFKIFQELPDYEIDIRIMVTTSKNLSKLVGIGRFYRALYTFISGGQIHIPPLRERKEDITFLAEQFTHEMCQAQSLEAVAFSPEAMLKLTNYYWTHNINELITVIQKTFENLQGLVIEVADLSIGERKATSSIFETDDDGLKLMSLKEAERLLIKKALIHTSENRTQAAKILGVSIRTLRNKINEYRNEGANYFINLR